MVRKQLAHLFAISGKRKRGFLKSLWGRGWVRKLYLIKTVRSLFTIQIYEELFCERSLLKLLNKIFEKHLNKSSFFVKL